MTPLTRILFAGLWCMADRAGRLEDRPGRIKAEILPYDNCDIEAMLNSLQNVPEPFVKRYKVGTKLYIQVVSAPLHFNPHPNEKPTEIPPCSKKLLPKVKALQPLDGALALNPSSLNPDVRNPDNTLAQAPKKRESFQKPTPAEATAYAKSIGFRLDGEGFCAHYEARGWKYGPGRPMVDWKAAIVTWKKSAPPTAMIQPKKIEESPPNPQDLVTHDDIKGLLGSLKSKEMKGAIMKTLVIILCCATWSLACRENYALRDGVCEEQDAAARPSDELPPRSGMPAWQNPKIHAIDIENTAIADAHHPSTCASNCLWTGASCICNPEPGNGKLAN